MSEENVGVVRGMFDAWNQHDPELLASHFAADGVADWSNSIGPARGVYRGRAAIISFYEGFLEAWDDIRWEPLELLDLDEERVLTVSRLSGRGSHSGVEVTGRGAAIWTVRDSKIARAKLFQNKQEALEAAGLSE